MNSRISKRDPGIELARIMGCLIVIGVHVSLGDWTDGRYDLSRGYINCLLADGVAVFWLITGCFLFSNSYQKILLRTAKTIAIPIALYSIFCLHFYGLFLPGSEHYQFRFLNLQEYLNYLNKALALEPTIPCTEHLWYCYTYILVVLAFPVLQTFVRWMSEDIKREKWFCVLVFIILALNDYSQNRMLAFSHHGLNAAVPAAVEILLGAVLYHHKDYLRTHKLGVRLLSVPMFFFLNLIRMYMIQTTGSKAILYWYSTIGVICAFCIVMFFAMSSADIQRVPWLKSLINKVSRHTFWIYLVHIPVRDMLFRKGITTRFLNCLSPLGDSVLFELSYVLVFTVSVFLISLLVSIILHFLSKQCVYLKRRIFQH